MNRRYAFGIGLILLLAAAVSCGTDDGTTSPKAGDGVLLRASDLPGMRLREEVPVADPAGLAEQLGGGESCACPTVFKDDIPVVIAKLKDFGFKRGYSEFWDGAGRHGLAFAAEFDTADHAKAALAYMDVELFRECVNEPYCSNRVRIKKPSIPDFVGMAITPLRPKREGRQEAFYKFLFRLDSVVYGVMDGADNAYDPASVSQAQALALVQRVYDRVKGRAFSVLESAPPSPLGPAARAEDGGEGPDPAFLARLAKELGVSEDRLRSAFQRAEESPPP